MVVSKCPSRDLLIDLNQGRLSPGDLEQVASHLEQCTDCLSLLEQLASEGTPLTAQLRHDMQAAQATAAQGTVAWSIESALLRSRPIACPHCHQPLHVDPAASSDEVHCPACQQPVHLARGAGQSSLEPDAQPTRLGRYELLEQLGQGAFGTVWRAHDTELDREVAVKLPRTGVLLDEADEERFLREARSSAQLQHPHIVAVYDVGRQGKYWYIVSDFVRGGNLAQWITARRLSFREAAQLLAEVAEALEYAHSQGVVHRDLKPSNIMLALAPKPDPAEASQHDRTRSARRSISTIDRSSKSQLDDGGDDSGLRLHPKIMDFGLAKRETGEVTMTVEGQVLGTPAYMSPEQIRDPHAVDGRTDIYSAGVILYQLLTGELPFRGVVRMLLHQVLHDEPRAPRKLNDRIPRDLETITLKCLNKDPAARYPTAGELAADLRRWLRGEPIHARPISQTERLWRWCKRNPLAASLGTIAALLLILTAVLSQISYFAIQNRLADAEQFAREKGKLAEKNFKLAQEHQAARIEADQQRIVADDNFQLAHSAVKDYFTTISESRLFGRPGLQPLRKELLEHALRFYQQFVDRRADDPKLQFEFGIAYQRIAQINREIGQLEPALPAAQKAVEVLQRLERSRPDNLGVQLARLQSERLVADLLHSLGRFPQALETAQKALAEQLQLREKHPHDAMIVDDLANSHSTLGSIQQSMGQFPDAVSNLDRAREIQAQAVADRPDDLDAVRNLAYTLHAIAGVHMQHGAPAEALRLFRESSRHLAKVAEGVPEDIWVRRDLATMAGVIGYLIQREEGNTEAGLAALEQSYQLFDELQRESPRVVDFREGLVTAAVNLGNIQLKSGNLTAARQTLYRGDELSRELLKDPRHAVHLMHNRSVLTYHLGELERKTGHYDKALQALNESQLLSNQALHVNPTLLETRYALSRTWNEIGMTHAAQGRLAEALTAYTNAVNELSPVLAQTTDASLFRRYLSIYWINRADVHERLGESEPAEQARDESRRLWPTESQELVKLARELLRWIPPELDDKSLTPHRQHEVDKFVQAALDVLDLAVERGLADTGQLQQDAELSPLHAHPRFQQLLDRLQSRTPS